MEYISYARKEIDPKITDEAAQALIRCYLQMRGMSGDRKNVISATPRQLEGAYIYIYIYIYAYNT